MENIPNKTPPTICSAGGFLPIDCEVDLPVDNEAEAGGSVLLDSEAGSSVLLDTEAGSSVLLNTEAGGTVLLDTEAGGTVPLDKEAGGSVLLDTDVMLTVWVLIDGNTKIDLDKEVAVCSSGSIAVAMARPLILRKSR